MKKISLYVDEEELAEFDKALPERGRSEVIRELMRHFQQMKFKGIAEGIIVCKPGEDWNYFLISLLESYCMKSTGVLAHGIVRVPTEQIIKANLGLGDLIRLYESDAELLIK